MLVVISSIFFALGLMRKGMFFYFISGILLMGCGMWIMQDGLTVTKNTTIQEDADAGTFQVIDGNVTYMVSQSVEINILSWVLILAGLVSIFLSLVGLTIDSGG